MAQEAEMQKQDVSDGADEQAAAVEQQDSRAPEPAVRDGEPSARAGGRSVEVGNFRVFSDLRLPEYDMGSCKAYAADNLRREEGGAFALVTDPTVPTRHDLMRFLTGVHIGGQIDLLDYEIVHWPLYERNTMVLFYEKPAGGRVLVPGEKQRKIDEHDFAKVVIEPLMNVLQAVADKGMTHRNIRADNLFFGDPMSEKVVVGDCCSAPAGFNQPLVYETISRMTADPAGRGLGSVLDDLYALGMTIAALGIGHTPLEKLREQDIIDVKLSKGSFQAVVMNEKLPLVLIEPVRGLCVMIRKNVGDLPSCMPGSTGVGQNRCNPIPNVVRHVRRIFQARIIIPRGRWRRDFKNWVNSLAPLRDGTVEIWLRRGLADNDRAKHMAEAIRQLQWAGADKRAAEDILIAKSIIILDPSGAIRFKGFSAMVDGLGSMLSYDVQHGRGPQRFPMSSCGIFRHSGLDAKSDTARKFRSFSRHIKTCDTISSSKVRVMAMNAAFMPLCVTSIA